PGPDITAAAAASLAGVPLPQARHTLADLARVHLIAEHMPGRFAFHDLLRAYSAELDGEADRGSALHRVLDHYLYTACAASHLITVRHALPLSPLQPGVVPEQPGDKEQAAGWLRAELQVLVAACRRAADSDLLVHAWQLPWSISIFLDWYGYWHESVVI